MELNAIYLRHVIAIWAALSCCVGRACAGQGMLALIPADATAALVIRDLNDLRKKGDKLEADVGVKDLPRVSELFEQVYRGLGVSGGVDQDGSAAIVVVNPKLFNIKLFKPNGTVSREAEANLTRLLVGALPFLDRDKLAANFGFKKGELKPDAMARGNAGLAGSVLVYAHGNHLFLGFDEKAILSMVKGKRAGADLPAARRELLDKADILLHVRREPVAPLWEQFFSKGVPEKLAPTDTGDLPKAQVAEARRTAGALMDALNALETASFAVRVDAGVGVNFVASYPKDGGKTARAFLTLAGTGSAKLDGLPDGRAIVAQAWRSNGVQDAAVARLLIRALHDMVLEQKLDLSAADEPVFVGVFGEVWERLRGSRLAVYQNREPNTNGLLSAVAILDTDNAEQLIATLKRLARVAEDQPTTTTAVDNRTELEHLIRDLGARKFRVREAATTHLELLGEPALPYLEKALTSHDLEVVRRARLVQGRIVKVVTERRKEVLSNNTVRKLHPTLAFTPRPEVHEGQTVEVLRLQLSGAKPGNMEAMRSVFGPDWDKVRLAARGKQVAVLIGSDRELLWNTLANLRDNKPGLAASRSLAGLRHSDPARQLEFHLSLTAARALLMGSDLQGPKAAQKAPYLTSFALTAGADALRVDFWMPAADIKTVEDAGRPH